MDAFFFVLGIVRSGLAQAPTLFHAKHHPSCTRSRYIFLGGHAQVCTGTCKQSIRYAEPLRRVQQEGMGTE
ncbi:hypothetical protein B0I72DRAFT_136994 [Yarrowia lipolytica]|uniref:Secreted protein n=1 Tax=Yarrowia lipolytica TaxID=4952 RepID=A0A371CA95_YARLL|nr:hypothetical protein BKA91DRAFT_132725 [Yarrowia lipolytica]KAE8172568.1 hypothetical protein BKA90DRAFT_137161 [Yarrowia lipolytica]RDW27231.1 hypothetical protein B0I71DRAFT_129549 [Yarrowia lipolytica]RDW33031.1 hypothetical protein B0I72DRAFT_136994 [Yarrowia lipolytica]RDW39738.1 hypothetical protein B0I73DRAFT_131492 [Yarrowia lipolytica]